MSREILFRAKAINRDPDREYRTNYKNGDWVYGLVTTMYDDRFPNLPAEMKNTDGVSGIDVDHRTIGEYTGLTDKNGTKIFEGDIVRHYFKLSIPGEETATDRGVIKWDCRECFFFRTSLDGKDKTVSANCVYEVIGNIYDNPELVKD